MQIKAKRRSSRFISEFLEPRRLLTNPVVIDLLALYTTQAKLDQGGDAAIGAEIQAVVDATNQAMQNSLIPITIRLVHAQEIPGYSGSGDLYVDRTRLQTPGDGFLDSAQALRDAWGADLVHLVTNNSPNGGGNAALMTDIADPNNDLLGFSAMDQTSLQPSNLTLAHELGHNLGAGHERNNPTQNVVGPFSYSYGYRYTAPGGGVYHDIMSYAYAPDLGIPYYANPAVSYAGAPTGKPIGDPDEADLASTFAQTAPIVAGYRATVIPDTAGPGVWLASLEPDGAALTFSVRFRDDSAVDQSSIDSQDVLVNTPEGFHLQSELISVNAGTGNAYEKIAKYRVTLPDSDPDPQSLTFSLRANAVKDINGNFAPAGAFTWSAGDSAGWDTATARNLGTQAPRTIAFDRVDANDEADIYRITLTVRSTLSVELSGITGDIDAYVFHDNNDDGLYQGGSEYIAGDYNPGSATRNFATTLDPGDYYIWVYRTTASNYTMAVDVYSDLTPPAASLDATDVRIAGGAYLDLAVDYSDDRAVNGIAARYDAGIQIDGILDGGGSVLLIYYPDGTLNTEPYPPNAKTHRTYYRVNAYNAAHAWSASENGVYTVSVFDAGANPRLRDVSGNNIPITTIGQFRIAIGQADATAPAATVNPVPVLVPAGATYDFTVTYRDNVAINPATINSGDVRVTGPDGFDQLATLVSASPSPSVGSIITATYRITAPGGGWDYTDDGAYSIAMQPGQVKDTNNNSVIAGAIGTITVHVPYPGDASGDDTVDTVDFNLLAANFARAGRGFGDGDFNFDGSVDTLDFNTLASRFGTALPAAPVARLAVAPLPDPQRGEQFARENGLLSLLDFDS